MTVWNIPDNVVQTKEEGKDDQLTTERLLRFDQLQQNFSIVGNVFSFLALSLSIVKNKVGQ